MHILFPSEPFSPNRPDPHFAQEYEAASACGFQVGLVDPEEGTFRLKGLQGDALYRGWMLTADRYADFHTSLMDRGVRLITSPADYRFCHELPQWYSTFQEVTPHSVWFQGRTYDAQALQEALGAGAIIVKDYVKSAKHYWHEACFIPDQASADRVVARFLELQGEFLNGGLVFREFLRLRPLREHGKSGMPLTLEYRLFIFQGKVLGSGRYWEDTEYPDMQPPSEQFEALVKKVPSPFFTVDLACDLDGRWWVMELGDGQVAGLPQDLSPEKFYNLIKAQAPPG